MQKRIEWIDILRGIAMYFVILGHAFVSRTDIFRKYIYSFHMPLFFFVSGLTYKDKNYKFKDFIKDRFIKIIIPYLIINIVVFIIKHILHLFLDIYNNLSIELSLKALIKAFGNSLPCIQSWFLPCLLIVELIFYLLKRLIKSETVLFIAVICVSSLGYFLSGYSFEALEFFHINTAIVAILFYYFGYIYMKKFKDLKIRNNFINILVIIFFLIVSIFLQKHNSYISMNVNKYGNIILFILSSVMSIIFYMKISMLISNKDKAFKYIGTHSMFFLGYHAFFLTIIKRYFPVLLSNLPLTVITSVCAVLIIYPMCELVYRKYPIFVGRLK